MSVCLVAMPWQALESPSLPIGLLKAVAVDAGHDEPLAYHGSLRWAEFLLEASDATLTPRDYIEVAEEGLFDGLGDWVFAGVLHSDDAFGVEALRRYAAERGIDVGLVERMRALAADFVDLAAAEILAVRPTLVGFSTTFMQNVPSLATAYRIKQLAPEVAIAFGGGNCDGPMGIALHRNFPAVDFVIRGEAEFAFPALLSAIAGDRPLASVPSLCWRDNGERRVNEQGPPVPPSAIPVPLFDDWFERLAESPVSEYVEPKLVLESARGCWWGEKHHCTFCGLNGTGMAFRAKRPDVVVTELTELVRRHQTLDVIMVDNIIDNRFFGTVLPRLADLDWDLRIHYEVKSNLRQREIEVLRASGVAHVQPGIESLVTPALRLMDKGVTGIRNVRTLRDCESAGLTVSWNWLYGFPGERRADYTSVLRQVPRLVHLQPPAGTARILLERFSPYFEDPALGFPHRRPARIYDHVYALPSEELNDMVYLFDTDPAGLAEDDARPLREEVERWSRRYPNSSLRVVRDDDEIVIEDRRVGWPQRTHRIVDPRLREAYRELEHGRSVSALADRLDARGLPVPADELAGYLSELDGHGLLFGEGEQWITLATRIEPVKVV